MPIPLIIGIGVAAAASYGAKKAYDGVQKHSESDKIVDQAKAEYASARRDFDSKEKKTLAALSELGQLELDIGQDFRSFSTLADALLKGLNKERSSKLELSFPKHKLQEVENYTYSAVGVLGSLTGASVAGATAGFAVYGGVMTFAAASTGTAISALSGVAATNATLAAIGGGSLAAGGLGIAGGTAILGAAVAAPILAIAGWAYDSHGDEALGNARIAREEVNSAIEKLKIAGGSLHAVEMTSRKLKNALTSIRRQFNDYFDVLRGIDEIVSGSKRIGRNTADILNGLQDDVLRAIENGYALAAILTKIITTPLFKLKESNGSIVTDAQGVPVMEADAEGAMILNEVAVKAAIANGMDESLRYTAK